LQGFVTAKVKPSALDFSTDALATNLDSQAGHTKRAPNCEGRLAEKVSNAPHLIEAR
jgi:hypothetical protein